MALHQSLKKLKCYEVQAQRATINASHGLDVKVACRGGEAGGNLRLWTASEDCSRESTPACFCQSEMQAPAYHFFQIWKGRQVSILLVDFPVSESFSG